MKQQDLSYKQRAMLDAYVRQTGRAASLADYLSLGTYRPGTTADRYTVEDYGAMMQETPDSDGSRQNDATMLADLDGYSVATVDGREVRVTLRTRQAHAAEARATSRTSAVPHADVQGVAVPQGTVHFPRGWTADTRRTPSAFAVDASGVAHAVGTARRTREDGDTYYVQSGAQHKQGTHKRGRAASCQCGDCTKCRARARKQAQRARAKQARLDREADLANARTRSGHLSALAVSAEGWDTDQR